MAKKDQLRESLYSVAIDIQGFLYVADTYSEIRLWWGSFGINGSDPGQFNHPHKVIVNETDLMYISDGENLYFCIH